MTLSVTVITTLKTRCSVSLSSDTTSGADADADADAGRTENCPETQNAPRPENREKLRIRVKTLDSIMIAVGPCPSSLTHLLRQLGSWVTIPLFLSFTLDVFKSIDHCVRAFTGHNAYVTYRVEGT